MNKTKSKLAIIIGIMLFMLNTMLSFAAPTIFTDIDNHWAKEYIEDIYKRQITTGYPDATFKPEGNITKSETIVIIAKLMGYSDSEERYYINQYKDLLQKNNILDWAQGAVAYALFNDILLEKELESLTSISGQTYAKRYEVVTYIGRVLQYGAGEELEKIYVIPYIDEMSIPNEARRYVNLLLNKKILDETSNDRRFLPYDEITRAEVAKLVSLSAKILDNASNNGSGSTTPSPSDTERKTVVGYIDNIIFGDKNIISIKSGDNRLIYEIDPKADIHIDGKTGATEQLEVGQEITVMVEDNVIIDIKVLSNKKILEGYFYYCYSLQGQDPKVYIRDNNDKIHSLSFTSNSKVYFEDKAARIEDLNAGDIITITYIDDEIVKIQAEPKEKHFEGIVRSKNDKKGEYALDVLLDNKTVETFDIDSKATLKRDKKSVNFEKIKVGDEVEITTEYGTVVSINAFSVKETVKGYIKKIVIGQKTEPTEITVEKFDGTMEAFTLTPDTVIRVEDERAGIYDLRLNYEIELEIENNEVIWMETYRSFQGSVYVGKVAYVDARRGTLELQTKAHKEMKIYVDDETIYNDEVGDLIRLRDIYVDDEVVIVVEDDGHYATARRVFVIIRR